MRALVRRKSLTGCKKRPVFSALAARIKMSSGILRILLS
jgi:hypothetical protein